MNANALRASFTNFFGEKAHKIVSSAPIVVKNDPTLMFTNAGMNQFKDYFLGNARPEIPRIANSQKCLRVSGKHNDLEEVGHDTYHHTMFEMLGNWSFGDYFKKEAIAWAWEYLTEVLRIDKNLLYVTVFEGDASENLAPDTEAFNFWKQHIDPSRILNGNKKDNFWEMGETGPCGPCSEIHIDLRDETDKVNVPGHKLVNASHPEVIEIWNLVFIQFNRKSDGSLEQLPDKHVDTGMGFERLCRVVQKKKSNYDTDIFMPVIDHISRLSAKQYGANNADDVAMRVIADHLRAVSFAIADGQIPSNNKAGYVIRRILRRAIRYNYTYLNSKEPSIYLLVATLADHMGNAYPELVSQRKLIETVIYEEETTFLRTLEAGIKMLNGFVEKAISNGKTTISGTDTFLLYDTFGFPLDLTELILRERNMEVDHAGFNREMTAQKERSRAATSQETGDWVVVEPSTQQQFVGYDLDQAEVTIARYRTVRTKNKEFVQLVFDHTPFYGESGGQIGDRGAITSDTESVNIVDTVKENNLIIHIAEKLPVDVHAHFTARIDKQARLATASNHSATHLLHMALRRVLGTHVEQKGSLVSPESLRFDFSHFQKVTVAELDQVEKMVNQLIRQNSPLEEFREMPVAQAQSMGAMALFGEKYGDHVRVIRFGDSVELCGGTHVASTGQIGMFKIVSEGSISAGIRRIQAITGDAAWQYFKGLQDTIANISEILGQPQNIITALESLKADKEQLARQVEQFKNEKTGELRRKLESSVTERAGCRVLAATVEGADAQVLKDLAHQLRGDQSNFFAALGSVVDGKPSLAVIISDSLAKERGWNAGLLVREMATAIQGGGGGQAFFATAGGKKADGIDQAMAIAKKFLESKLEG